MIPGMVGKRRNEIAERLRLALEMFDFGVDLYRGTLRRENPGIGKDEIDRRVRAWLRTRPGAEDGDAPGRRRTPPA